MKRDKRARRDAKWLQSMIEAGEAYAAIHAARWEEFQREMTAQMLDLVGVIHG